MSGHDGSDPWLGKQIPFELVPLGDPVIPSRPPKAHPNDRDRVFDFIRKQCLVGATCDEVERGLELSHGTASARINELRGRRKVGVYPVRIVDSKMRRMTRKGRKGTVWIDRAYLPIDILPRPA